MWAPGVASSGHGQPHIVSHAVVFLGRVKPNSGFLSKTFYPNTGYIAWQDTGMGKL